ncbi:hypothetical protein [Micromonospora auratinigra]|uniref:Uncharacterized protein n=1 Tax=Micromonospora auratinigra TaxID=261654 RepID=A0A1A8Z8X4_9ACTN|nr:hypothetical protein [Micromonospora auratinigra]SBT40311.1 hypothetical protein GA0070611_1209 [Micromonospora auratinigra]
MTVHDGRATPGDGPLSLFDHALGLHVRHPHGPLPHRGRPYPVDPESGEDAPYLPTAEVGRRLHDTLAWFFAQPEPRPLTELHHRLRVLPVRRRIVRTSHEDLPGSPDERRATGLWLARHARNARVAAAGLVLLHTTARPGDAPVIRTLGLLGELAGLALTVLARLPDPVADLTWLAERLGGHERMQAVQRLCEQDDPVAAGWLLRHGISVAEDGQSSDLARRIADVTDLATVLRAGHLDTDRVRAAARVLLTMAVPGYEPVRVTDWPPACRAVADLTRHLAAGPVTLDDAAYAVRLAEELLSGPLALLDWPPGQRAQLVDALTAVARRGAEGPTPAVGTRTDWRRDWLRTALAGLVVDDRDRSATTGQAGGDPPHAPPPAGEPDTARGDTTPDAGRVSGAPGHRDRPPDRDGPAPDRLRLRVVVPDPALPVEVELRPLVNGEPVVARAFDRGCLAAPERLLDRLRAGAEPREVRLAEAACTEGCCGALWTTLDRAGDRVRWHGWRGTEAAGTLPTFHFDAGAYDAELDRVAGDHGWEWPARTLARLLRQRLVAESDLLGRWDCRPGWIQAPTCERDRVQLTFTHPDREFRLDQPWLQFRIDLRPDGDPAAQVESIVAELRRVDPKQRARIVGGSPQDAEALGFRWPDPQ